MEENVTNGNSRHKSDQLIQNDSLAAVHSGREAVSYKWEAYSSEGWKSYKEQNKSVNEIKRNLFFVIRL